MIPFWGSNKTYKASGLYELNFPYQIEKWSSYIVHSSFLSGLLKLDVELIECTFDINEIITYFYLNHFMTQMKLQCI